jgi:uncharacterized protein (DUF169 family)
MTDLKSICGVLTGKVKIRGKPVAISLFRDSIPEGYEPIETEPCTIVRYAMDEGRRVYFDADHHDCLVGVYHAGMGPGKKEIVSGEYLSTTSSFFTYEGAARLKSGMRNLPPGMVKAIGAAPLDDVPEGVDVDWIVVVCNPHNANMVAGCRVVQEGILPSGVFGTSLCGELFSTPWHEQNIVVTFGDFGGRMNNRIKQDQVFVVIPIQFAEYLPKMLVDLKVDVNANLAATKPPDSKFWKKKGPAKQTDTQTEDAGDSPAPNFSMEWDKAARQVLMKAPEGMIDFIIENAENFAREKGYPRVSEKSLDEQMQEMGMSLDDMLD